MKNYPNKNEEQYQNAGLFGTPTREKASGLCFSLLLLFSIILSLIFSIVLSLCGVEDAEKLASKDWYLYISYLFFPIAVCCVGVWYFRWTKISFKSKVKSQKCPLKYYLIAIILQIGLFSLSEVNGLFLGWLEGFGYQPKQPQIPSLDGFGFIGAMLVVAVLPAVFEEIFFRGLLLDGLKTFGLAGGALLCGGLFALYHQTPVQTIYQFCCGVAFALVAIKAGSVLPTILSHFLNNAIIIIFMKWNIVSLPKVAVIVFICISALCLVGALGYLIFIDKKQPAQEQSKGKGKGFFLGASFGILLCAVNWISALVQGF